MAGDALKLLNRQPRNSRALTAAIVDVYCNDDEVLL